MITNNLITSQREALLKKKRELSGEKKRNEAALSTIGVTSQAAWKYNSGRMRPTDESAFLERKQIVDRNITIDLEIGELNNQLTQLHTAETSDKNQKLLEVFKEIFTHEQMVEIKKEAVRRMNGESGFKMSFSIKESVEIVEKGRVYKKVALEQMEKMIEFRIMLTKVIEDGCKKFDQGKFLKIMSPLNRLIIPINELNKAKLKLQSL
jgi:hypothetical protein